MLEQVVTGAPAAFRTVEQPLTRSVIQTACQTLRSDQEVVGVAVRGHGLLRVLDREASPHLVVEVLRRRGSRTDVPS